MYSLYQHYKGDFYVIDEIVLHTETNEDMVLYHNVKDHKKRFVRPKKMFFEEVEKGKLRFRPIKGRKEYEALWYERKVPLVNQYAEEPCGMAIWEDK